MNKSQEMMELVEKYTILRCEHLSGAMKTKGCSTCGDIKAKLQAIADSLDWISVKDRLPENNPYKIYWIYGAWASGNKGFCSAGYDNDRWYPHTSVDFKVTDWKIPEPPKGEG